MIRVLCFNPTIDRTYFIDNFRAGQLHRDNSPKIQPGGKGINVARVLTMLGEKCVLYGFIAGSAGDLVRKDILSYEIHSRLIQVEGETRSTINIIDKERALETEIKELGPKISEEKTVELISYLSEDLRGNDIVVCSGVIGNGMKPDIYNRVSRLCEDKAALCFIDASGESFAKSIPGKYYFTKPNLKEFLDYIGEETYLDDNEIRKFSDRLIQKGFENLMISKGSEGALLINKNKMISAIIPKVPVISTIGSGDASVAGFAAGVNRGYSFEDTFSLSMACGVSNAMHSEVGFVNLQEIKELIKGIKLIQIQ
jgi:tagatose 6-phosphate kinase